MKLDSGDTLFNLVNHLAASAPKVLKKGEPEFDAALLSHWLGRDLAFELLSTLNSLRIELVPRHAEDWLLVNAFWDKIVYEAASNPQKYFDGSRDTFALIKEFGDYWKKPLSEYEAIYSIEYLKIDETPITLYGVEFFTPTSDVLLKKAIPLLEVARWSKEVKSLTLASVRVDAASNETALETGKEQVLDALNLMKVSALQGRAGKMPLDALVQWRLSGHFIVGPVDNEKSSEYVYGFHHPFSPAIIDLGNCIREGMAELGLHLLGRLPKDINERITRSMHWITHSTTHESDDYKIVDLCTALEILLVPEGRRVVNKGTTIALRYNLFGGTLNPSAVRWFYERRNDVLHGNKLPVVTQTDTWHLRLVCYTTLSLIIHASARRSNVLTLSDLIATTVETQDRLTTFVKLADAGNYQGSSLPQLIEQAKRKLRKISLKGC